MSGNGSDDQERTARPLPRTEQVNEASRGLGSLDAEQVVRLLTAEEAIVIEAVGAAGGDIATAARRVAEAFTRGGRTILLGAGAGGHVAFQEVSEMPGTFGVAEEAFQALVATSRRLGESTVTSSEDDVRAAPAALTAMRLGPEDVVIGIASSGTTPFVVEGVASARSHGAWTCGIANNPDVPLLGLADLGILLDTGPEVLTGSTRLKAATAQKLALNRITTAAMVVAGRVRGSHMVDLVVRNAKLRDRAIRIVSDLMAVGPVAAETRLARCDWSIRAVLDERSG